MENMAETESEIVPSVLGIDVGTTSVKVTLINATTHEIISSVTNESRAAVASDIGHVGSEQSVRNICLSLQLCIASLPRYSLKSIVKIGICGQMHGVVLWKRQCKWDDVVTGRNPEVISNLFTWQDGRCTQEFLATLPLPNSHLPMSTGYGCATLLWLKAHSISFLDSFDRAGTIHDFVVAMMCGLDKPKMSFQNAASWGYFDAVNGEWNKEM